MEVERKNVAKESQAERARHNENERAEVSKHLM